MVTAVRSSTVTNGEESVTYSDEAVTQSDEAVTHGDTYYEEYDYPAEPVVEDDFYEVLSDEPTSGKKYFLRHEKSLISVFLLTIHRFYMSQTIAEIRHFRK